MRKILYGLLAFATITLLGCSNSHLTSAPESPLTPPLSSVTPPSDNGILSPFLPPIKNDGMSDDEVAERITVIGEGFIGSSGEKLEVTADKKSITKEYLVLRDGRKICEYFIDYFDVFLVIYDPAAQTVEPILNMQVEFEGWDNIHVEQGPHNSLLILCRNEIAQYHLDTKETNFNFLELSFPEKWSDGALIAMTYDVAKERYVVAFTEWEMMHINQTNELYLATFDKVGNEIERHHTSAVAIRDFFNVWSIPSISMDGDDVFFKTFSAEFAEQYAALDRAVFGKGEEKEKKYYADLAQSSYYKYAYNLVTKELSVIGNEDPFQNINWKLAKYAN